MEVPRWWPPFLRFSIGSLSYASPRSDWPPSFCRQNRFQKFCSNFSPQCIVAFCSNFLRDFRSSWPDFFISFRSFHPHFFKTLYPIGFHLWIQLPNIWWSTTAPPPNGRVIAKCYYMYCSPLHHLPILILIEYCNNFLFLILRSVYV